jgi:hypothetical protein
LLSFGVDAAIWRQTFLGDAAGDEQLQTIPLALS